jgi:hypothetical protein
MSQSVSVEVKRVYDWFFYFLFGCREDRGKWKGVMKQGALKKGLAYEASKPKSQVLSRVETKHTLRETLLS